MVQALSTDEILQLPAAVSLEVAGRAVGIGRTKIHTMARRGELPFEVLRLGSTYRVRKADLLKLLGLTPDMSGTGTRTAPILATDDSPVRAGRAAPLGRPADLLAARPDVAVCLSRP